MYINVFLVLIIFLAVPLLGSYSLAMRQFRGKILKPFAASLDADLFAEMEKDVAKRLWEKAGPVPSLIVLILAGCILVSLKNSGMFPEAELERAAIFALYSLLVSGSWYAFTLHLMVKYSSGDLANALKWNLYTPVKGEVVRIMTEKGGMQVVVRTSTGEITCPLLSLAQDEVANDLTVGAKVALYCASNNLVYHAIVTELSDAEQQRRLIENSGAV